MPAEQEWWRRQYSFGDDEEAMITIAIPPLPEQGSLPEYQDPVVVRSAGIVVELEINKPHFAAFSLGQGERAVNYKIHEAGKVYPVKELSDRIAMVGWFVTPTGLETIYDYSCSLLFLNTRAIGPIRDKHRLRHRQHVIQAEDLKMIKITMLPKINLHLPGQIISIHFGFKDIEPNEWHIDGEDFYKYNPDFGFNFHDACQALHQAMP